MESFTHKNDITPDSTMRFHFACGCVTSQIILPDGKQHAKYCPEHTKSKLDHITKSCPDCGARITMTTRQLCTKRCKSCSTSHGYTIRRNKAKRIWNNKDWLMPHELPVGYNDAITQSITLSPCRDCSVHLAGLLKENITCHKCPKRISYSDWLATDPLEQLGLVATKYGDDGARHYSKVGMNSTLYSNTINN